MHCVDLGESFQIDPNSNEYLLAKCGFDTAENEPCKVRGPASPASPDPPGLGAVDMGAVTTTDDLLTSVESLVPVLTVGLHEVVRQASHTCRELS